MTHLGHIVCVCSELMQCHNRQVFTRVINSQSFQQILS